jgi:hypothetical protein
MAKGKKPIEQYEHLDKGRKNNPPAGLVTPAASATAAKVVWRTGISAPCQMYPNTGGKTITTIAAHTA